MKKTKKRQRISMSALQTELGKRKYAQRSAMTWNTCAALRAAKYASDYKPTYNPRTLDQGNKL